MDLKTATVALVVKFREDEPSLTTVISDEEEIEVMEAACREGRADPLVAICEHRSQREKEEEEFSEYVEELLAQPFLRKEIQDHGVQWLKSKLKIEDYQRAEAEAAQVIADYAYRLYQQNRGLTDFFLTGPNTRVRVRVFVLPTASFDRSVA